MHSCTDVKLKSVYYVIDMLPRYVKSNMNKYKYDNVSLQVKR